MAEYFCFVDFGNSEKFVVRSGEVRDLAPDHPDDFEKGKDYDVNWQENDGSFDGFYPAKIICMAASLPELKVKARQAGVQRMPRSYNLLLAEENSTEQPSNDSEDKAPSISRKKVNEDIRSSRKRRMMATLHDMNITSKHSKRSESSSSRSREKSSPVYNSEDQSQLTKSPQEEDLDLLNKSPLKERTVPCSSFKSPLASGKQLCSSGESMNTPKSPVGTFKSASFVVSDITDGSGNLLNEHDGISSLLDKIENDQTEELSIQSPVKIINSDNDSHTDFGSESGSEDDTAKIYDKCQELKSKLASNDLQISTLKAGLKISERERLELREKSLLLEDKVSYLEEQLACTKPLKEENKKLQRLVKTAGELLLSGLEKFSHEAHFSPTIKGIKVTPPNPLGNAVRHLDFSASINSGQSSIKEVSHRKFKSESPRKKSKFGSPHKKSKSESPCKKSKSESPHKKDSSSDSTLTPVALKSKKSVSPATSKKASGLSHKEIVQISEAVRDDTNGNKPLNVDENRRVCIGKHIRISKEKWTAIKSQTKVSLFVKKLADSAYGSEALKVRMIGMKAGSPKQVATPAKVDTFVAALLFENPDHPNIDAAASAARILLATKMQDEARMKKKKDE